MRRMLGLAVPLLIGVGCSIVDPGELQDLNSARRRWERAGLSSYQLTVLWSCYCAYIYPAGVRVTVVGATVQSRIDVATGAPIDPNATQSYPDVPGFFALVERTLLRGADELTVEYDADTGYPRKIEADPIENAIDDEFTVTVSLAPAN